MRPAASGTVAPVRAVDQPMEFELLPDGRVFSGGGGLSGNSAEDGGGIFNGMYYAVGGTTTLTNSIVAGNSRSDDVALDVQVDPNALYSFRRDSFKHRDPGAK